MPPKKTLEASNPAGGRFGRSLTTKEDMDRFYVKLAEGLEMYKGYGPLPPLTHNDTFRRVFQLAYMIHYVHREPDIGLDNIRDSSNWLLVYDEQARWQVAIPEAFCPEGIETLEAIHKRLEKALTRLQKMAAIYSAEFGRFDTIKRQGGVYLRHSGPVLDEHLGAWDARRGINKDS